MASPEQMATIKMRRVDDAAREMMAHGVDLTWEQRRELGDDADGWLRYRLDLIRTTDEDGVYYRPRAAALGREHGEEMARQARERGTAEELRTSPGARHEAALMDAQVVGIPDDARDEYAAAYVEALRVGLR